jgi:SHS2 domain-containing protein
MERFKFIDITTADVAFLAYGKDLNELFENAALAMFEVMINTKQVEQKVKRKIKVKGNDLLSLMFNWLNELLVYVDSENLAFSKFQVRVDENNFTLEGICEGEEINPEKHETRTLVKACTYHSLKIKKNKLFEAQVILDI